MFLAQIGQERTEEQVDLVTSVMGLEPPSIIADIGCGLGRHSIELAKRGFTVQGFDSNPNYLKQATEDAVAEGVSDAFFIHMDMREFDHTKTLMHSSPYGFHSGTSMMQQTKISSTGWSSP